MTPEETKNIDHQIDLLDNIQTVPVSPFFKNRVLQQVSSIESVEEYKMSWLTPKLQWAALALIVVVNIVAVYYTVSQSAIETNTSTGIESFAEQYQLIVTDTYQLN